LLEEPKKEFSFPIKKVRSDNGTEVKNTQVEEFLDEEGIKHEFSTPYTPQQNGVVERKNCTLIDMARTMLDEYKTPDIFWLPHMPHMPRHQPPLPTQEVEENFIRAAHR
jgi:transposase InsO family protein